MSILGSGSSGNCTFIASEQTAILIDAGLSARAIEQRLELIGRSLGEIRGICVSHEHSDHTQALRILHQRSGIAVYANGGTIEALARSPEFEGITWRIFTTGCPFAVGDLMIEPFAVPHDAYEPVGFVVSCGDARVGVVTDMGMSTTLIRERLKRCGAVVVESNHDEELLRDADRPWYLKQRIRGRQGHLSNRGAAALLSEIAGPQLRHVFLAHLSEDCNTPDLAQRTAREELVKRGYTHIAIRVTYPDRPTEVCVI